MKGRCNGVLLYNKNNSNKALCSKKSFPGVYKKHNDRIQKKEAPHCTRRKGSLTVEASVLIPFITGILAFLLFYFRIMQVQITIQDALEETGQSLAMLSVKELEEDADIEYGVLAKTMLCLKLKDNKLINTYVSAGAMGVSLLCSEFDGDYISLNANYRMCFPIKFFGNKDFLICQKTSYGKWNGCNDLTSVEEAGTLVYVTEYGEVYHKSRNCTYLELSVQSVSYSQLKNMRNSSGEIYRKCEQCPQETNAVQMVYITKYGNRYHSVLNCSGLKRTIYQKKLTNVGGMTACMKCSRAY